MLKPQSKRSALKSAGGLSKVKRTPFLRDQIYDLLRAAIMAGDLAPKTPVIEVDIAARVRASRTPVREALYRLEAEGMLEPRRKRGSAVTESHGSEDDCLFEMCEVLETLAAKKAARLMDEPNYVGLERLVELMRASLHDPRETERLDTAFYANIVAHASGDRLRRILRDLRSCTQPWRVTALSNLERRKATVDEHIVLLQAMRSHDEVAVERTVKKYMIRLRSLRPDYRVEPETSVRLHLKTADERNEAQAAT